VQDGQSTCYQIAPVREVKQPVCIDMELLFKVGCDRRARHKQWIERQAGTKR